MDFESAIMHGNSLVQEQKYEEAINFYTQQLKLQPQEYAADFYLNLGIVHYNMETYPEAIVYYKKAAQVAADHKQFVVEASAENNLGNVYKKLGEFEEAIVHYKEASNFFTGLRDTLNEGITLYNMAICYKELTLYDLAADAYERAAEIFDQLHREGFMARVYQSLGNMFRINEDFEASLKYHHKALELKEKLEDEKGKYASLNDIGNVYRDLRSYEEALDYYLQALSTKEEGYKATVYGNLGEVNLGMGKLQEAEQYYRKSLAIHERLDDKKSIAQNLTDLGHVYLKKERFREAEDYLKSAEPICKEFGYKDILLENGTLQEQIFQVTGRFEQAYRMLKMCYDLREELLKAAKDNNTAALRVKYDFKDVENNLMAISRDNVLQANIIKQQAFENRMLIGGGCLALVAVFAILLALRNKQRLVKVEKARVVLEQSLRIDTQHRTKNFLQVIVSLSGFLEREMQEDKDAQLVKGFRNKVDTMILVNNALEVDRETEAMSANFGEFLHRLVGHLSNALLEPGRQVHTVLDVIPLRLHPKQAYPLALIANELITNALKYGLHRHDAQLSVGLRKAAGFFELEIRDNGPGLPQDFDVASLSSSGHRLLHIFSKQMQAELSMENEQGLKVQVKGAIK
jgi:two-component sensor histidine kinase/Flp pilus assembly protein TadD